MIIETEKNREIDETARQKEFIRACQNTYRSEIQSSGETPYLLSHHLWMSDE